MRRIILNYASHYARRHHPSSQTLKPISKPSLLPPLASTQQSNFRFFSSSTEKPSSESNLTKSPNKEVIEDVSNEDFKILLNKYLEEDNEEMLPEVMNAMIKRRLSRKHEDTDDELLDELRFQPLDNVPDAECESDFEEACETDEEIDNLCNAREHVEKKMVQDEYFNMSDTINDDMIEEAIEKGFVKDTKECEEILC